MNLTEKRRAELMVRDAMSRRVKALPAASRDDIEPPAAVSKALTQIVGLIERIEAAGWRFSYSTYRSCGPGEAASIAPCNENPAWVAAMNAAAERRTAIEQAASELTRHIWSGEADWSAVEEFVTAE